MTTINGTAQADTLTGTAAGDLVYGLGGNDWIASGAGLDSVFGGAGDDTLHVSADQTGSAGSAYDGGDGLDTLDLSDVSVDFSPFPIYPDNLYGYLKFIAAYGSGTVNVTGAAMFSVASVEIFIGSGHDDTFDFLDRLGDSTVYGGDGHDVLNFSSFSKDVFYGGAGDDYGNYVEIGDQAYGGAGDDWFSTGSAVSSDPSRHATIDGGDGTDTFDVLGQLATSVLVDLVRGVATVDQSPLPSGYYPATYELHSIENLWVSEVRGTIRITGNDGANKLEVGTGRFGGATPATISGGGGGDTMAGAAGDDHLDGGAGSDCVFYTGAGADYAITVSGPSMTVHDLRANSPDGTDTLTSVETLTFADGTRLSAGGAGADTLHGTDGSDTLSGGDGNDVVVGAGGADLLDGGAGADLLWSSDRPYTSNAADTFIGGSATTPRSSDSAQTRPRSTWTSPIPAWWRPSRSEGSPKGRSAGLRTSS